MAMSTAVAGPAPWLTIGRGSVTYTQAEAEAVLAGFAFGTEQLIWPNSFTLPADPGLATGPRAIMRHTWSYRIFDCAPSSPYGFTVHDLLVIAALNPRATASDYLQMEAILPDLNEALAHIAVTQTFWMLPRAELGTTPPPSGTSAWWLWRAWSLLMGLDNVNVAKTYKTLHHKRPWLFPNFDTKTMHAMGNEGAWQALHDELNTQATQFTELEQWFAVEATERGGVAITRLRIHDVLLWGALEEGGQERRRLLDAGNDALGRPRA